MRKQPFLYPSGGAALSVKATEHQDKVRRKRKKKSDPNRGKVAPKAFACAPIDFLSRVLNFTQAATGADCRLTYCKSATSAAGVTPEMRAAAPRVAGRAAASLPRISAERLPTAT